MDAGEGETCFFSTQAKNCGFKLIDDSHFMACWYNETTGMVWQHYRLQQGKVTAEPIMELPAEAVRYVYADGVWYYTVRTEGSTSSRDRYALYASGTLLLEGVGPDFAVAGEEVLYVRENCLCAIRKDKSGNRTLYTFPKQGEESVVDMVAVGTWVLASYGSWNQAYGTYLYDRSNGQAMPLSEYLWDACIVDGYVYAASPNGVYRLDGQTYSTIRLCPVGSCNLSMQEDGLYFHHSENRAVYRIDTHNAQYPLTLVAEGLVLEQNSH